MNQTSPTIGVPQTLSARLANLASRPNIHSTLILSRKDGSIIQATGILAKEEQQSTARDAPPTPQAEPQTQAQASESETAPTSDMELEGAQDLAPQEENEDDDKTPQPEEAQQPPKAYEPTHAEAVAAHIFAFISTASALSDVLSDPKAAKKKSQNTSAASKEAAADSNPDHLGAATESTEDQANERDEESDVKLLRLRGKVHEIIIIPDRKYLLCVVQDLTLGQTGHTSTAR
ncbi:rRNA processing protein [Ascosphaera pollenicola]|nr:rRNA processing protein [Ascosphaera pollenicola]